MFSYLSVCSGIEAASVAWGPLGAVPVAFAQFDPDHNYKRGPDFPSKVLAHHWPHVPNLGDMTLIDGKQYRGTDVLVGGTPCQSYSVAGLRQGLADPRGNLTLTFAKMVHDMKPRVVLWENVPGVLTSDDNAFGCFLAALCGNDLPAIPETEPTEEECNYNAKTPTTKRKHYRWSKRLGRFTPKWPTSGYVAGPDRICAWRVLDAQFFGVAQRRRRVFLVSVDTRSGLCPGKILFEPESLRRDTPPSRETKQETTGHVKNGSHWDGEGLPHPTLNQSHNTGGIGSSNQELFSQRGSGIVPSYDPALTLLAKAHDSMTADLDTYVVHGTQDPCVQKDMAFSLGRNNGAENAVCWWDGGQVSQTLDAVLNKGQTMPDKNRFPAVLHGYPPRVRRLTPVEAARLQGFPDNHTNILGAADGPRYKAYGNSMAVPAMRWLGVRIILALEGLI